MAVFVNSMEHTVVMVGYRADGLKFDQNAPEIKPGQARYVNQDHFGDNDWFIMVAYMKDAKIPDKVGVTQSVQGGGGGFGITIAGNGFSISGSGQDTAYFSNGMAAVQTGPHDLWQVVEYQDGDQPIQFEPGLTVVGQYGWAFIAGGHYTNKTLHGW